MNSENHIHYLQQRNIDKTRWDDCINRSANGLIYGYSQYLDSMSSHWDALVLNDYQAIMPLPWNKKYGIYYLYQPAFTAMLGIFGNDLTEEVVNSFLNAIPRKFRLVEIFLNHKNLIPHPSLHPRINFVLSLNRKYEDLYSGYKESHRRNIRKAGQHGCVVRRGIPVSDVLSLSKPIMEKATNIKGKDYAHFEELYVALQEKNKAITYGVYWNDNELLASCVYFFSHQRANYILVGNHPNGKTLGASHYLIDRFIADHAGEDLILDFEGSDIQNLAFFYSSFGATVETYPFLKINNLPGWMAWLK
jgi:hypothetical protein